MKTKFENFLKKSEMNLHTMVKNRNPKMLHTGSPNWPRPSLLRWLTIPCSVTEGRTSLAVAMAQAASSSSLAASADRGGKAFKALCFTLSRNAMNGHLLVSAYAWGSHRNS